MTAPIPARTNVNDRIAASRAARLARQAATEAPQPSPDLPTTLEEAQERFYRRYGLQLINALLGSQVYEEPPTVEDWITLAEAVRDVLAAQADARKRL